ncbi:MAG: amidophosphoribosyltransferase [Deltaproteobacteria bacterium]|nr:amidophosphoribosyltransferase [Deltaproteobacteria bacterium]
MCGIIGIFGHPEASKLAYLGLHALQHRGQESAGIVSSDGTELFAHRGMGLVPDVFDASTLASLPGSSAIGHVRYSTTGQSHLRNAQPLAIEYAAGALAVAHNGNLVNAAALRHALEARGSIFQSATDTEVVTHLIARAAGSPEERVGAALQQVEGAFSLVFLTGRELIAARDPRGIRPLALGRVGDAWLLASEECAFDLIGGRLEREVEPGELLVIDRDGPRSAHPFPPAPPHSCVFEYVYFARPDSRLQGGSVYYARERMGRRLAALHPVAADVVIPVPDSGMAAAIGYARESGIPYDLGLIRSHYVGRTFIEPQQSIRHFGVKLKLSPVREVLAGKRVVVVDDSIVRGTTSRKIVDMIRGAGAREVHLRISSPPTVHPCFYGIDTPSRAELIAVAKTLDEIRDFTGADSVGYLSAEGMVEAVAGAIAHGRGGDERPIGFCAACFTGEYPIEPTTPPAPRQRKVVSR